jgi:hypothetical protein
VQRELKRDRCNPTTFVPRLASWYEDKSTDMRIEDLGRLAYKVSNTDFHDTLREARVSMPLCREEPFAYASFRILRKTGTVQEVWLPSVQTLFEALAAGCDASAEVLLTFNP